MKNLNLKYSHRMKKNKFFNLTKTYKNLINVYDLLNYIIKKKDIEYGLFF